MRATLKRIVPCVALAFAASLGAASRAEAQETITLDNYRRNVSQAAERLSELATFFGRIGTNDAYERWARENPGRDVVVEMQRAEAHALVEARRLMPPAQSVRWEGGTLSISNVWLHRALDEFEQKSGGTNSDRARRAREMAERVRAVGSRLGEYAEGVRHSSARDKEAEKGRLAAILRGPDFNKQAAKGGALADLIERLQKWIQSLFAGRGPRRGPGTGVATAAQFLIFGLAFAVFAFVLWRFWRTRRGGLKRVALRREPRVILGEQIAPDESPADLLADAERLARAGDLRGAIRRAYVALLLELGDRDILRLARHKTNRDYLQAVRRQAPPLYAFMQPLTVNFERYWYGYERATEEDWRDFLTNCRRTLGAE